jgi:hypothetical protein
LGEKRMLGFEDKREADGAEHHAMNEWVWDCEVEQQNGIYLKPRLQNKWMLLHQYEIEIDILTPI